MPSNNCTLNKEQQAYLLDLARQSIRHGLTHGKPIPVALAELPAELKSIRATLVTLERQGQLRGCIGRLEAARPLAEDIAENAYSAAFQDPRFPALRETELEDLDIHLSLLTAAEPIASALNADAEDVHHCLVHLAANDQAVITPGPTPADDCFTSAP